LTSARSARRRGGQEKNFYLMSPCFPDLESLSENGLVAFRRISYFPDEAIPTESESV
jgi:hypothetical protein